MNDKEFEKLAKYLLNILNDQAICTKLMKQKGRSKSLVISPGIEIHYNPNPLAPDSYHLWLKGYGILYKYELELALRKRG